MTDRLLCHRCDVEMVAGTALAQTYVVGSPDSPGDERASTFSAGGPGKMIECWKCPTCGRSVSR